MAERVGLHSLKPAEGSRKARKRVGRGNGGATAGRGTKGYGARADRERRRDGPADRGHCRAAGRRSASSERGAGRPAEVTRTVVATIAKAFTVPEIRKKLAFTALILALYRLGSHIPVPGVNADAVKAIQKNFANDSILGFLNLFSGGGLQRIALFALTVMPYITASIILQLLTVVVPALDKLQKEGEVGQARIT